MSSVIYCNNLHKNYNLKKVLKGVNLEVPAGNIFALLGTNGAGKTTLIRTLLGLIPHSSGEIKVLGEEPYRFGAGLRQRIGYVSEEQGLYGWMKVSEIISFCKSLYHQWDSTLIDKYLSRFGIQLNSRIATLSKGQTTKLALLLAIAPKPELLILDEPMSGLDPLAQHEFLQVVMKDVNLEGSTIFFSTHNLADVESIATQVAIIYDGSIQAKGSIHEICQQVSKIKLNAKISVSDKIVVLEEEQDAKTVLISSSTIEEIAASSEVNIITDSTNVSLREAFLFFCSGGDR